MRACRRRRRTHHAGQTAASSASVASVPWPPARPSSPSGRAKRGSRNEHAEADQEQRRRDQAHGRRPSLRRTHARGPARRTACPITATPSGAAELLERVEHTRRRADLPLAHPGEDDVEHRREDHAAAEAGDEGGRCDVPDRGRHSLVVDRPTDSTTHADGHDEQPGLQERRPYFGPSQAPASAAPIAMPSDHGTNASRRAGRCSRDRAG